jgi:taurine--2-oxoglutarate transaminase
MSSAAVNVASNIARQVVKGSKSWPHKSPALTKLVNNNDPIEISPDHDLPMGSWSSDQIREAVSDHVMLTWAPGKARHSIPIITHGSGVHLFDDKGNKFLDWTSQAICSNAGYDLPDSVVDATMKQMKELPFIYGGLGIAEVRARLSKLCGEILPGDLQGMVFPSSGSEANEAAIMAARRYTKKFKVINWYRSYHGGTTNSQQATGDFRRWMGGDHVPGFVKASNPYPLFWDLKGETEDERTQMALNMLEEQVLNEGPDTVALIQFESVVGGGGVLVPPPGYMQGVRAICDKYDILLHCDEVMVGFGRTGKLFGFQHYDGVVPDIVTAAKGLSSAALPISMMATRQPIMEAFDDMPLGWGSTYQAHPVAMACAYENVKHLLKENVVGHVQELAPKFEDAMKVISENHPSIKQYRAVGMFGCFDVQNLDGSNPQLQHTAIDSAFVAYKKAYTENGLIGLLRPPHLHVAPPLSITEEELMDGFERQDKALYALDDALGF